MQQICEKNTIEFLSTEKLQMHIYPRFTEVFPLRRKCGIVHFEMLTPSLILLM